DGIADQNTLCYCHKIHSVLSMRQLSIFCLSRIAGLSFLKELAHFIISSLGEVAVPLSDATEWFRRARANDFVDSHSIFITGLGRRNRNRNDNTRRVMLTKSNCGSPHRRSSGKSIINQDDRFTLHVRLRTITAISAFPSL